MINTDGDQGLANCVVEAGGDADDDPTILEMIQGLQSGASES